MQALHDLVMVQSHCAMPYFIDIKWQYMQNSLTMIMQAQLTFQDCLKLGLHTAQFMIALASI